jgi:hypothetical protein
MFLKGHFQAKLAYFGDVSATASKPAGKKIHLGCIPLRLSKWISAVIASPLRTDGQEADNGTCQCHPRRI